MRESCQIWHPNSIWHLCLGDLYHCGVINIFSSGFRFCPFITTKQTCLCCSQTQSRITRHSDGHNVQAAQPSGWMRSMLYTPVKTQINSVYISPLNGVNLFISADRLEISYRLPKARLLIWGYGCEPLSSATSSYWIWIQNLYESFNHWFRFYQSLTISTGKTNNGK